MVEHGILHVGSGLTFDQIYRWAETSPALHNPRFELWPSRHKSGLRLQTALWIASMALPV